MSWKDALLSSGVPMEYSVRRILEGLGVPDAREFKYLRPNENGIETQFSIDLKATNINFQTNHWLNIFIECKYRKDGTLWVFAPDTFSEQSTSPFSSTFVHLDLFSDFHRIDNEVVEQFAHKYIACSKGVEITDAGNNPKSIVQALSQLKFALADSFADSLWHQIDHLLGRESPIFSCLPILVTTADLWRLNEGVEIADIRKAKEIDEVATKHDLMFCYEPPDNELEKFARRKLVSFFDKRQITKMNRLCAKRNMNSFDFYADSLARQYPCFFAIATLKKLEAMLANSIAFFGQDVVFLEWQVKRGIIPK